LQTVARRLPERAIMSVWVRPFAANSEFNWFKLFVGCGSLPFTSEVLETKPSNLPNSTVYEGPPDYTHTPTCVC